MAAHRLLCFLFFLFALANSKSVRETPNTVDGIEAYIAAKKPELNPRFRLQYHIAGPVGWINDPNGFSYYKGQYHMFYQYYPFASEWGPMHWGHATSHDLVNWTQQPTALIPGDEMCFSGSAVEDGDTMVLMYTGRRTTDVDPFFNETQYLAYSDDGITFHKYEGNPVLSETPNGAADFRDPKVWKHEDHWYVILGSQTDDKRGRVLLYRSPDMKNWEYLSVLAESNGDMGYMYECPDFFEMNGKFIILWSPQGMEPQGDRYKNIYQTGYVIGSFDYETFQFVEEVPFQELDFGHDFYASQTTEVDGRRYQVAWFNTWEVEHPEAADGWAGALTLIRELKLVGDRLTMQPVEAMDSLRSADIPPQLKELQPEDNIVLEKASELNIKVDLNKIMEVIIEGTEGGQTATIRWNPVTQKMAVERGSDDVRQVEWEPIGSTDLRLFLDSSSLELFCGEGEVVFSSRLYAEGNWRVTNVSPDQTISVRGYTLKRSVPE